MLLESRRTYAACPGRGKPQEYGCHAQFEYERWIEKQRTEENAREDRHWSQL